MSLLDWFHKEPQPSYLVFDHLPFKLAVAQRLMYDLELLGEKYTGGDAFFQRYENTISTVSDEEALARLRPVIAQGFQFFRELRIPASLAERVDRLYLGEENEIYNQINPQWLDFEEFEDGTDFDITGVSEAEIRQFPNLRSVTFNLYHEPPGDLVRKLEGWGLEVNPQD